MGLGFLFFVLRGALGERGFRGEGRSPSPLGAANFFTVGMRATTGSFFKLQELTTRRGDHFIVVRGDHFIVDSGKRGDHFIVDNFLLDIDFPHELWFGNGAGRGAFQKPTNR